MNIFSVLSMGKSNLHEPSMSAMFAYLLNPNQDHGLGRKLINGFLMLANEDKQIYGKFIDNNAIKFEIDLEVVYSYEGQKNYIDIQIKILDSSYNELHRIIIENKIRSNASNSTQLNRYYEAVINDKNNDDAFTLNEESLSAIFLTPKLNHKGLNEEFNNLKVDNKTWIYWNSDDSDTNTVVKLIQNIIELEQKAEISPINEYMRHTLKAFTHYIIKTINISNGKNRVGEDIGEVKQREDITIEGESYALVLRDSGQIQLLNSVGDRVDARPRLKEFLNENNIVKYDDENNTRVIGKYIIKNIDNLKNK